VGDNRLDTGRDGRSRSSGRAFALAAAIAAVVALTAASATPAPPTDTQPPARLADTGLYDDFAAKIVASDVHPYAPQYPLWSDGAEKHRWIRLPAGTAIDASDPDAWVFPVGTRIWKEFAFARRIETRFMERIENGVWLYATYRWNDDESDALLVGPRGVKRAAESRPGVPYGLPGVVECRACHESGLSPVLGFSALQLSTDRDPLAPHATPPEPGALDLAELVRRGLIDGLPEAIAAHPPRIRARDATERAAFGYLHGNCSNCHNRRSPIASLGLFLTVRADGTAEALASAVDHPSHYRPTGTTIDERIVPGDPAHSLLIARVSSRVPTLQMPPMDTHLVDDEALALLRTWITSDLADPAAETSRTTVNHPAPSGGTSQENPR